VGDVERERNVPRAPPWIDRIAVAVPQKQPTLVKISRRISITKARQNPTLLIGCPAPPPVREVHAGQIAPRGGLYGVLEMNAPGLPGGPARGFRKVGIQNIVPKGTKHGSGNRPKRLRLPMQHRLVCCAPDARTRRPWRRKGVGPVLQPYKRNRPQFSPKLAGSCPKSMGSLKKGPMRVGHRSKAMFVWPKNFPFFPKHLANCVCSEKRPCGFWAVYLDQPANLFGGGGPGPSPRRGAFFRETVRGAVCP